MRNRPLLVRGIPGAGSTVTHGMFGNGMAFLRLGAGAPLVFLPGLSAHHHPPHGMDRWFQVRQIWPLGCHYEVWWIQRRTGLMAPATMAGLADDYAGVLAQQFNEPVDVLGVSTGGSVAFQLAADHPSAVRRLVLVCSGCRLGPQGREAQRKAAVLLRRGEPRHANGLMMSMMGATPASRRALAGVGWLIGSRVLGAGDADMLATIDAEDAFDLTNRLGSITVPALVIGGDRDAFYGAQVFEQTAALLPHGHLVLRSGVGHLGAAAGPQLTRDVLAFLAYADGCLQVRPGRVMGDHAPPAQ